MRISMRIGDHELRSAFARHYLGTALKQRIERGLEGERCR